MLRSASARSALRGSSFMDVSTASAAKLTAFKAVPPEKLWAITLSSVVAFVWESGGSRLTHWSTTVTTARMELHESGRSRPFAASIAGTKASSWRGPMTFGSCEEMHSDRFRVMGAWARRHLWEILISIITVLSNVKTIPNKEADNLAANFQYGRYAWECFGLAKEFL